MFQVWASGDQHLVRTPATRGADAAPSSNAAGGGLPTCSGFPGVCLGLSVWGLVVLQSHTHSHTTSLCVRASQSAPPSQLRNGCGVASQSGSRDPHGENVRHRGCGCCSFLQCRRRGVAHLGLQFGLEVTKMNTPTQCVHVTVHLT